MNQKPLKIIIISIFCFIIGACTTNTAIISDTEKDNPSSVLTYSEELEKSKTENNLQKLENNSIDFNGDFDGEIISYPHDETKNIYAGKTDFSKKQGYNFLIGVSDIDGNILSEYEYSDGSTPFLIYGLGIDEISSKDKSRYVVFVLYDFRPSEHDIRLSTEWHLFFLEGDVFSYDKEFEWSIMDKMYNNDEYIAFINDDALYSTITVDEFSDHYIDILKKIIKEEYMDYSPA